MLSKLAFSTFVTALAATQRAIAAPSSSVARSTSTITLPAPSSTITSSASSDAVPGSATPVTVATSIATVSASIAAVPSQAAVPPTQAWCPSRIFCAGELLQTVNIAQLWSDPKTFVDKPTSKSSASVLSDFQALVPIGSNATNVTEGQIENFVDADFKGEGLELEGLVLADFDTSPPFLSNVSDPVVKAWAQTVHGYWPSLIRQTNDSALCGGTNDCESTLIPLNHTFVVPGGRFREQYYWDSFWIIEGLIQSQLYDIVNATLQNFMDELEKYGFIPNGGRIYYLNRSQPPLFTHMLAQYIAASNDTSILTRALPLAEREMTWWQTNRTISVTSPFTNKTYAMTRYAVNNTAPRPESYLTDYTYGNDPSLPTLNDTQKAELYSQLASGAETGWDYSYRWTTIADATPDGLRTLQVKSIIPICLNSILYKAHLNIASFYEISGFKNSSAAATHTARAEEYKAGILDLFWDSEKLAFYDFNIQTNSRQPLFTLANFYPYWSGIFPSQVLQSSDNAFKAFAAVHLVMSRYNGTIPTTFVITGQQWDAPNAWPPHQYITLNALRNIPANLTNGTIPLASNSSSTFSLLPAGQLGLNETQLPGQPISLDSQGRQVNASTTGSAADINLLPTGEVTNGGNATSGEGWAAVLQRQLANRYIASALCSWQATGGEVPNVIPRLSDSELNVTQSQNNTGNMFEKFSNVDIDSAGSGGEYTVQAGFGWTNGVVLWVASTYASVLTAPTCPDLITAAAIVAGTSSSSSTSSTTTSSSASASASASSIGTSTNSANGITTGSVGWVLFVVSLSLTQFML